jgi:hypothetical protein
VQLATVIFVAVDDSRVSAPPLTVALFLHFQRGFTGFSVHWMFSRIPPPAMYTTLEDLGNSGWKQML